ncbi:hypothetical protein [Peribacillus cavernae]|nr:hypothetical protein [Peribacillus cavernae]MDQ0220428.1 hypothetical protein [Peribacillus cavernae]
MEFKKLAIDDLIPASYNPRKKLKPDSWERFNHSLFCFQALE